MVKRVAGPSSRLLIVSAITRGRRGRFTQKAAAASSFPKRISEMAPSTSRILKVERSSARSGSNHWIR
jgi:hypothetical protein